MGSEVSIVDCCTGGDTRVGRFRELSWAMQRKRNEVMFD